MKQRILLVLGVVVLFASCKKNKEVEPPVPAPLYKLKTITFQPGSTTNFEYDAQNRVSKISSGTTLEEFSYSSNTITRKLYQNSVLTEQTLYTLNSAGLATEETQQQSGTSFQYTYNNQGQMLTQTRNNGSRQNRFYTGLNMDSMHIIAAANNITSRWYFEYNISVNNTVGQDHEGIPFKGKENEKAYTKRTIKFYDTNGQLLNTQVNNYTYETDNQGRISREIMTGTTAHDFIVTYY